MGVRRGNLEGRIQSDGGVGSFLLMQEYEVINRNDRENNCSLLPDNYF
jgi:hypothetical protein